MRIRKLSEAVIQKIAAGEVVDRPASVLKELLENSIDAGATRIRVEIEGGGIARLLVSDDGCGMTPEEMRLAIERYTTSKLTREEDLRHIKTLGFRGEALAAICAVARVRLLSRPPEVPAGFELVVAGGQILAERPAAHPGGTTVEVSALFYNVPARRKFLSTPAAEARRALERLRALALAHPAVGFLAFSEGKKVLDLPPAKGPEGRLGQIYGEPFVRRLIPVAMEEPGWRLLAFFSPPELAQTTRTEQHLFLSGRPVRMGSLAVPIYQIYARLLPRGQHPVFFLYLEVDPELVDVNVHPKKEEVRFQNEEAALDFLRRAALRALGRFSPSWEGRPVPIPPPRLPPGSPPYPRPGAEALGFGPPKEERRWRVLGQVQKSFVVVEEEDGVELVDQHAAHERILFEQYRDGSEVPVQHFLIPVQVELPFDQAQAVREALPALRALGVILEPFGPNVFLVRGWPAPLAERQARWGFLEPLREAAEQWGTGNRALLELWRRIACAAAIRAGEELSPAEQESLISAWKNTKEPARCPHGRPVAVKLTFEEIARKLGR
jgi:DNA mismatch repair protein MutL